MCNCLFVWVVLVLPGSGECVRTACAANDDHRGGGVEGEVKGQRLPGNRTSRRQAPGGEQRSITKIDVTLDDVTCHPTEFAPFRKIL